MKNSVIQKLVGVLAIASIICNASWAQDEKSSSFPRPTSPRYSEPVTIYYEIGLKIKSNGNASGIVGMVPIPIDWPEQTVTVVKEIKTDNLKKFSYKDLTRETRQLVLKANRLSGGETAQGSVLMKIEKRNLLAPESVEELKLAKKIPGRVKSWLKPSPYIESKDKRIKGIAKSIEFSDEESAWENVEKIYKWVRDNIRYEFDQKIHSCVDALKAGHGDCEELSSLFVAICRAKGIPARAVWIPAHTYPEFYLQDENGEGYWFACQAAGSYEFGAMTELRPVLQKGDRFRLPGSRELLRYIRPTLTAKDAPQGLSIEFISREVPAEEIKKLTAAGDIP